VKVIHEYDQFLQEIPAINFPLTHSVDPLYGDRWDGQVDSNDNGPGPVEVRSNSTTVWRSRRRQTGDSLSPASRMGPTSRWLAGGMGPAQCSDGTTTGLPALPPLTLHSPRPVSGSGGPAVALVVHTLESVEEVGRAHTPLVR
jgi:hypothetical protein